MSRSFDTTNSSSGPPAKRTRMIQGTHTFVSDTESRARGGGDADNVAPAAQLVGSSTAVALDPGAAEPPTIEGRRLETEMEMTDTESLSPETVEMTEADDEAEAEATEDSHDGVGIGNVNVHDQAASSPTYTIDSANLTSPGAIISPTGSELSPLEGISLFQTPPGQGGAETGGTSAKTSGGGNATAASSATAPKGALAHGHVRGLAYVGGRVWAVAVATFHFVFPAWKPLYGAMTGLVVWGMNLRRGLGTSGSAGAPGAGGSGTTTVTDTGTATGATAPGGRAQVPTTQGWMSSASGILTMARGFTIIVVKQTFIVWFLYWLGVEIYYDVWVWYNKDQIEAELQCLIRQKQLGRAG